MVAVGGGLDKAMEKLANAMNNSSKIDVPEELYEKLKYMFAPRRTAKVDTLFLVKCVNSYFGIDLVAKYRNQKDEGLFEEALETCVKKAIKKVEPEPQPEAEHVESALPEPEAEHVESALPEPEAEHVESALPEPESEQQVEEREVEGPTPAEPVHFNMQQIIMDFIQARNPENPMTPAEEKLKKSTYGKYKQMCNWFEGNTCVAEYSKPKEKSQAYGLDMAPQHDEICTLLKKDYVKRIAAVLSWARKSGTHYDVDIVKLHERAQRIREDKEQITAVDNANQPLKVTYAQAKAWANGVAFDEELDDSTLAVLVSAGTGLRCDPVFLTTDKNDEGYPYLSVANDGTATIKGNIMSDKDKCRDKNYSIDITLDDEFGVALTNHLTITVNLSWVQPSRFQN
ncbi:hypothetical protein AMAG_20135 [Allomyces macrogynus ATCC 38327]|uniref:Uncharacterized protein n=1 Tax=Allomyces macrogynus (strain ATCC 38327) TaxID=578462 RepID=A0A0L0T587_ALLM3|nr:hypothetical protein AMAG_20135 [Allomyces macrogynus ATCC 38327]|eukprot:KNE69902.1 hypothetical protein AMAG_20135 [Allomyces macrogynus ATCC 38327]